MDGRRQSAALAPLPEVEAGALVDAAGAAGLLSEEVLDVLLDEALSDAEPALRLSVR